MVSVCSVVEFVMVTAPHRAQLTARQKAKATLRLVRFSSGTRVGPVRLSPSLTEAQRRQLEFWLGRLPGTFCRRLPPLKVTAAEELNSVRRSVFINRTPTAHTNRSSEAMHAASFIPQAYIVLQARLFRRRVELGRILYHELCHFVWARLGNPKRRRFRAILQRELREGVRGELGYSSELRKAELAIGRRFRILSPLSRRPTAEYVCESFCDTGSFVLLGNERRKNHSEYTLSRPMRQRRQRAWSEIVLESNGAADRKRR